MNDNPQQSPEFQAFIKVVTEIVEKAGAQVVADMNEQIARTLADLRPAVTAEIEAATRRALAPIEANYAELIRLCEQLKARADRLEGEFAEVRAAVRHEADEAIARIQAERDRGRP